MIEVIETASDIDIVYHNGKLIGTNSSNHSFCQRENIRWFMSGEIEEQEFYPIIKNWSFNQLPERVKLVVYAHSNLMIEEPLLKIPFPFDTCHFLRLQNDFFVGFSVYFDYTKWKKKWAAEFYFEQITKLVQNYNDIIAYYPPNTSVHDDDMFEFLIEFKVEKSDIGKTIDEIFEIGLEKLILFLDEVESKISGIARLLKICEVWKQNSEIKNEEFWQSFFLDYSEIISQTFSTPNLLFQDKAFVGGKNLVNKNGKVVDYIFKNEINNNITLVEIKTPVSKLIGKKYRGTYSLTPELSGAINQLLIYRDTLQKEFYNLQAKTSNKFEIFNPKCLLIIGRQNSLSQEEVTAFEIFRNELRTIEVITFDELFNKIEILLKLMEENSN